jgi:hypothetical protein
VWAALVFESDEVILKGVRLVVDAAGSQMPMAGVLFRRGLRWTVDGCEFVQTAPPLDPERARLMSIVVDARGSASAPRLELNECYFVGVQDLQTMDGIERGGQDAVTVFGPAQVQAVNCALAPHAIPFHLADGSKAADTTLRLDNCSVMAAGAATVFRLDRGAGARFEVQNCLFARLDAAAEDAAVDKPRAVLIQQTGETAGLFHYIGLQNRYHNLDAFWLRPTAGEEEPEFTTWDAFQAAIKKRPDNGDAGALVLEQSPWQDSEPLTLLKQNKPQQAFLVKLNLRELRQSGDPRDPLSRRLIGVERCIWGDSYARVPPLSRDERLNDPLAGGKDVVVDPKVENAGGGVYRSLNQALEEIKQRGTIRIRHTGSLPIDPVRLEKASLDVTIQPDPDHCPVLTLGGTTERDAFLFRVHDGRLTLKDLEFHLTPRQADLRTQSIVEVIGEGSVAFKGCAVTLDRAGREVPLMVLRLADPALVMKMDPSSAAPAPAPAPAQGPSLSLEDCLVRGDGELLRIRGSRPFVLEARNCLFALAGSLLDIHSSREDVPAGQLGVLRLEHVTAYLVDRPGAPAHLVQLQAGKDLKGLTPLQVRAQNSLFITRDGGSLVHLESPVTTEEQLRSLVLWENGKHNAYSNFTLLLDQQLPGEESPRLRYDAARWKDYTGERDGLFAPVVPFTEPPAADAEMGRVKKTSFKVREAEHQGYGVNLDRLPAPSGAASGSEE